MSGAGSLIGVLMGQRRTTSLSTASTKRSMTRKAEQRLSAAEAKAAKEVSDVDELEADLEKEFAEIAEQWRQRAGSIDALEIGLEKTDIVVEPPILLWIPIK
jgi:enoyl-CoA hydratase/carnithine racemase